jgi:hypothetical protein
MGGPGVTPFCSFANRGWPCIMQEYDGESSVNGIAKAKSSWDGTLMAWHLLAAVAAEPGLSEDEDEQCLRCEELITICFSEGQYKAMEERI